MKRIKFIRYKGKRILFVDSSNCTASEALELFHNSHEVVKTQKKASLLSLVNIYNVGYNLELIQASREYLELNKPFLKATAIYNASYLHKFIFHSVIIFYDWGFFNSSRFGIFDSLAEGKEWLIKC
jgi:hypothetical protein